MQHSWNELSESTRNFIKNKELQEAYQKGYRDSITEYGQLDEITGFSKVISNAIKRAIDAGSGVGGAGGAGGFLRPSTMNDLLELLRGFPSSGGADTGMSGIYNILASILDGSLSGKALEGAMQRYGRLFRQFGYEFYDNGGSVGIREIEGFVPSGGVPGSEQGFYDNFAEILGSLFNQNQIPWQGGFRVPSTTIAPNFPYGEGGELGGSFVPFDEI